MRSVHTAARTKAERSPSCRARAASPRHAIRAACGLLAFLLGNFWPAAAAAQPAHEPWIRHASFDDFAAGSFGDGGSNLYAARSLTGGGVQMIHRWDLNNDGFLDLFVGQDHDMVENEDVLVYWGRSGGFRSLLPDLPRHQPLGRLLREAASRAKDVTRLPSGGGGRSLVVDLNGDGYPEIVFCNTIHNYSVHMNALIYWGGADGYRPERRAELPTLMADGLAAADFNRDGFVDLAFANRGIEAGERFGLDQHLESYIYWNGPTGFSAERRTTVPSISAIDCAAGDLDGDGWPELLLVNNNAKEKSLTLYWGGLKGFSVDRRESRQGGDPTSAALADLDGDGRLDLIVTHKDNRAEVLRGTGRGLEKTPWVQLPTLGAAQCRAGDLDRDGRPELVFPNPGDGATGADSKQVSFIYWNGPAGFSPERRTELPTLHATDAALCDFDGDGWIDLAFANERDEKTYDVPSYVYWNSPRGFHAAARADLQGFGSVGVQAADLDRDGKPDLVLISRNSGSAGPIDSFIYWGNARHRYSPASMSTLPGPKDGAVPAIADLDQNGTVDIAFPNGWIYWGGPPGFGPEHRRDLGIEEGHGVSVADLNRDGWLDLVIPTGSAMQPGHPSTGLILWGGPDGCRRERRTELPLSTRVSQSATIADFNRDGFLDLIFTDVDAENVDIFWGDRSGTFGPDRRTKLLVHSASTVECADLNNDGWLDLILGGVYDRQQFGRPMRVLSILWGGPDGYAPARALRLEAFESEEQAVADLNRDGYLDIVVSNYHGTTTRSLPVFIYWGGPDGTYSESRRTSLPAESSLALTVADLDANGWPDLVVFNHVDHGDHGVGANIFWGGPEGYSYARRDRIQTFGPHFSVRRDIGNIYTRRLEEEYDSPPLECPAEKSPSRLRWKARTPNGTAVTFQVRSAATRQDLAGAAWRGPLTRDATSSPVEAAPPSRVKDGSADAASRYEVSGADLDVPAAHRWLQYRAILTTPDGGSTPALEAVEIDAARR